MSPAHVARHPVLAGQVPMTAWRKLARDPPVRAIDAWFVDSAPDPDQVPKLFDDPVHEWKKRVRRAAGRPSAFAHEPERVREVVKRDHGHDALLAELAQHVAVMAHLPRIELSLRR